MKIFIPATGPKGVLEHMAKEQIGNKIYPTVFILGEPVTSPIPIGEIIRCKVVEGGFKATVEQYSPEMEGL